MKHFRALLHLLLLPFPAAATAADPPPVVWSNVYNRSGIADCSMMAIAPDGGIVTVGNLGEMSGSLTVLKHSPTGQLLWEFARRTVPGNIYCKAAAIDSAGAVYAAGAVYTPGIGTSNNDFAVIKVDASGNALWQKIWDGGTGTNEDPTGIAVTPAGEAYVCGTGGGVNGNDLILQKYNTAGDLLWTRRYDGPTHGSDGAAAVKLMPGGGVIVAGRTSGKGLLIRYDSEGIAQWVKVIENPAIGFSSVVVDNQGNITAVQSGSTINVFRFDSGGNQQWTAAVSDFFVEPGTAGQINFRGIAVDGNGRTGVITGLRRSPFTAKEALTCIDSDGTVKWKTVLYQGAMQMASSGIAAVIGLPEGGFIAGGGWKDAGQTLTRVDATGAVVWAAVGSSSEPEQIMGIVRDAEGNLYTTAGTSGLGGPMVVSRRGELPMVAPKAVTEAADDLQWNRARLNGKASAGNSGSTWFFEYGPTTAYGTKTAEQSIGSAATDFPVSVQVSDLSGDTPYHYRLAVVTGGSSYYGADRTFTTPLSSYQNWAATKFGSHTAAGSAPGDDPDHDGAANRFEYAFGGNPAVPGSLPGLPVPEWYNSPESGIRYLAMTWEQNPEATDLLYMPEGSSDLQQWIGPLPGQGNIVIQNLPGNRRRAVGADFQRYLRLRISPAP